MSEQQKISIEAAIKIWGGIISMLISICMGLIIYIYTSQAGVQEDFNRDVRLFIRNQNVTNNVIFDLISDVDPNSRDKMIPYFHRYDALINRGVKHGGN